MTDLNQTAQKDDTYIDEVGEVWTQPTPYAYAKACKALHKHRVIAQKMAEALTLCQRKSIKQKWDEEDDAYIAVVQALAAYEELLTEQQKEKV